MRQSTDDGAIRSWREEAEGVEGDERGRSHATRQSTNDGTTRDEGADDAQGKEDGSSLPSSAVTESNNATGSTEVDKGKGAGRRAPSAIGGDEDEDNNG